MTKKASIIITVIVAVVVLVILAVAAWLFFGFSANPSGNGAPPSAPAIDTSGWQTYTSSVFGFSFKYPPSWQNSGDPLTVVNPHIFFGNPLNGTTTYRLNVFVYDNPQNLSAADYVSMMLASDTAMDEQSGASSGTAPMMAPQFSSQFAFTVDNLPAYELDNVFEFDHGAEDVYVQDGAHMLFFDFPVADLNPNEADPTDNNTIVHAMLGTLMVK